MVVIGFYAVCAIVGGLISLAVIAFVIDLIDKCF